MTVKSFSQLRKQSSKSNFDKLQKKLKNVSGEKKDYTDNRIWRAAMDKSGNGQAIIRFLPTAQGDDAPFVKVYSYAFKGPGGWFIENCPSTLGYDNPSPVLEANNLLWESGSEDDKKTARERKRKLSYYSNIYVVKDPANPENEGKVFLFKYGQKIFDKIKAVLSPEFEGDDPVDVFNMWTGANFKLRITKKDNYANYDSSSFENAGPLFDNEDDPKYEEIWNKQYPLNEFISPENFKSYDELKKRLDRVLGNAAYTPQPSPLKEQPSLPPQSKEEEIFSSVDDIDTDLDDDDLDAFKSLVE